MSQESQVEVNTFVDINPNRSIVLSVSVAFNLNWLCLQSIEVWTGQDDDIRCSEFRFLFNLHTLSKTLAAGWNGSRKVNLWEYSWEAVGYQSLSGRYFKTGMLTCQVACAFWIEANASLNTICVSRNSTGYCMINLEYNCALCHGFISVQELSVRRDETRCFDSHVSIRSLDINTLHLEMMLQLGEEIIRSRKSSNHKDSL